MTMLDFGGGWMALGMAQLFPTYTHTPDEDGLYVTQIDRLADGEFVW